MSLDDADKDWIKEQLVRIETSLLTEFHQWDSPVEMRQRSHSAALRALGMEVESIQKARTELEGPQAQQPGSVTRRSSWTAATRPC